MQKSESITELAKALSKAQATMKAALKDSANPFFKSKYADFASVWETCRGPLTENGLSVMQPTDLTETGDIVVETILMHSSGEWLSGRYKLTPVKNDPQSIGSATTYARRYALSGMVCLATEEDDDGNHASGNNAKKDKKTETKAVETEKANSDEPGVQTIKSVVAEIGKKAGATNGKPWTCYFITAGGNKLTTFDTKIAEAAKVSKEKSLIASITYKATEKGNAIESLNLPEGAHV